MLAILALCEVYIYVYTVYIMLIIFANTCVLDSINNDLCLYIYD